jgi:hypothetical protein
MNFHRSPLAFGALPSADDLGGLSDATMSSEPSPNLPSSSSASSAAKEQEGEGASYSMKRRVW